LPDQPITLDQLRTDVSRSGIALPKAESETIAPKSDLDELFEVVQPPHSAACARRKNAHSLFVKRVYDQMRLVN
jgi:hypothetical protein